MIIRGAFPFCREASFTGPAGRNEDGADMLKPVRDITLETVISVLQATPGIVQGDITPYCMRLDVDTNVRPPWVVVDHLAECLYKLFEHSGNCEITYP